MFKVSQSKVKSWRTCRAQYSFKHVDKLRRKRKKRPLVFGTIVHSMIEAHANGDDPMAKLDAIDLTSGKLFRKEREEYGDLIEDLRVIMEEYFDFWPDDQLLYSRRKGRNAEHAFEIEIADGILFKGKIDAVGRYKKTRRLVEHKTFTRLPSDDDRWRSVQSAVYIRAIEILGWWTDIDGTLWDYVRSKAPSTPQLLKNGEISRRQLDSLPTRVEAFIRSQGKDPKKFKEMIAAAKANRENYFLRIPTSLRKAVVDETFSEFLETAREMSELHGKSRVKTVGAHCKWCDYAALCQAGSLGLDVEFIKKREYTTEPEEALDDAEERAES